jgi:hypothetical protein
MSLEFFADGDSVTFKLRTRDLDGNMVDVDSAAIVIRKCNTTAERDWAAGSAVLGSTAFTNFATGVYRYSWSTSGHHAGRYVAQATVIRGGVTNQEKILVVLT